MYFTFIVCCLVLGWCGAGECAVFKSQSVNIAAIGPWQVDPTANFMGQLNFLNFTAAFLNNQTEILPDVAINLIKADTGTNPSLAITVSVDAVEKNIIAFIGGARTPQQQIVSYIANAWQIPHVGGIVTGAILSDKTNYPYFMRTSLADQFVCEVMMKYILLMKWSNVVLISQTDDYGTGNRQAFLALCNENNVTVWTTQVDTGQRNFGDQITQISGTGIRILVFLLQINEANAMMKSIKADGRLVNSDYVYLVGQVYFNGWYGTTLLNGTIFDGAICFSSIAVTTDWSTSLWNAWRTANTTLYPGSRVSVARTYWFLTEALFTLALGLEQYMDETDGPATNLTAINGTRYYNIMRTLNYTGVSGQVQFDGNGDRLALCNIYNIRQTNLDETSSFYANVTTSLQYSPFTKSFTTFTPVVFYGGRTTTPRDTACACVHGICNDLGNCICEPNYEGTTCDVYVKGGGSNTEEVIAIVIPIVGVAILTLVGGFLYYKKKRALIVKEVTDKQRSDIPRSSIKLGNRIGRGASGEVYSALFRGTEVAVKVLSAKNLSQSALQQFQLETAIMTGLRHPNIILFMGSCYDKSKEEFLLVMELCARGSLYDVLYNKNISLSIELQLHLAYQIVQGINFLHQSSPPIVHCDIKSHNVLLDEKWNCRICDFGITIFSSVNKDKGNTSEALGTVYWTAPEVLTGGRHTMQSDCYAIGILLWEIFHRQLPYSGRDPLQVAMEVCNLGTRPVMGSNVPPTMAQLITSCWSQDPVRRPSTQDIVYTLRDLAIDKPMSNFSADDSIAAPTGSVVFVLTDITDAYKMWDAAPKDMQIAMKQHNTILRTLLESYKGYEVSFNEHSFFVAFARISDAINWCLSVQSALVRTTWPQSILSIPCANRSESSGGNVLWNGLRVKMVVHKGVPQCVQDKISQLMKYEGPVVKRVLQLRAQGVEGTILVSKVAFDDIQTNKLEQEISTSKHKNILAEEGDGTTFLIVPAALQERLHTAGDRPGTSDVHHPYTILDIDADSAQNAVEFTALKPKESWVVRYEDLTFETQIGIGSGAEVHAAKYKGQEVAVKLLINQNFNEENNFTLRYLAATLNKVDHPNVLRYKGMVLDPPHICLVTELMQNSLYKFYTSNVPFPPSERIRIAKAVAAGMHYLSSLDDKSLGMNQRLNSNNILLGRNGEVKISDFAINRLYDSNRTLTSVNAVAWTPPEMLNGDEHISAAVPIYAFGIVMWEMLTRKRPYSSIHPIRLLNMVAQGHRPDIPNDCPHQYASLMQECWEGNPSARPSWDAIIRRLNAM